MSRGLLSLGEVQNVLQGLLAEQVPINDLARIYEACRCRQRRATTSKVWSKPHGTRWDPWLPTNTWKQGP